MGWSLRRRPDATSANAVAASDDIGDQGRLLPTGRLEAFSDGVFAIAITLLVLELHVPGQGEALVRSLEDEWARYLAYVVSFAFIGGVWIAHSNMTRFIKAADPTLMRLNLTLLLFVSLLPFTTAIAATHLFAAFLAFDDQGGGPGLAERVAAVVFGLIALGHVARLVFGVSFVVQDFSIPMWASGLAVVFMGFLAYEGFRLARKSG